MATFLKMTMASLMSLADLVEPAAAKDGCYVRRERYGSLRRGVARAVERSRAAA